MKSVGRTIPEPGDIKLDGDLSTKYGQTPVEDNMEHQSQGLGSEALLEVNKTVLLQPPIQVCAFLHNLVCSKCKCMYNHNGLYVTELLGYIV